MNVTYLNSEIELTSKIFLYYTDRLLDKLVLGSNKYAALYRDSLQLSFLLSLLEAVDFIDDVPYLGYAEISEDYLMSIFYRVREYWTNDIDFDYTYESVPATSIVIPSVNSVTYISSWEEFDVEIISDNTTSINLVTYGFDFANIDTKSLMVTVASSMDPIKIADDAERGFRIENNVFIWNTGNYYHLDNGDVLHFKYLKIN